MTCPAIGRPWNAICHGPSMESPSHPPRAAAAGPAQAQPRAVLRLGHAVAIIVGIVIGAGIFKAPSLVAGMAGSPAWMFAGWVLGGVVSLDRRALLRRAGDRLPARRRRLPLPAPRLRAQRLVPVRLGALFRDHHRLDRAPRLRLRRLHDAAPAARAAQLGRRMPPRWWCSLTLGQPARHPHRRGDPELADLRRGGRAAADRRRRPVPARRRHGRRCARGRAGGGRGAVLVAASAWPWSSCC